MYAQLTYFDGPRSPEMVAAGDRAGRERVSPAVLADDTVRAGHHATYVMRRPDGSELVIVVARDEETIDRAVEIIMSTPLLPGEDVALLPGPDRVERLPVVYAVERGDVVG